MKTGGGLHGRGLADARLPSGSRRLVRPSRLGTTPPPRRPVYPHSLQVADFDGDGGPGIYVAGIGLGANDDPEHMLLRNQENGMFSEHVIASGVPTHEAKTADLTGNALPDIVGKSYEGDTNVDVWFNEQST
jgi:hypothetical protein